MACFWYAEVGTWSHNWRRCSSRIVVVIIECRLGCRANLNHGWEYAFNVLRDGLGVGFVEEVGEAKVDCEDECYYQPSGEEVDEEAGFVGGEPAPYVH